MLAISWTVGAQELRFRTFSLEDGFVFTGTSYPNSILKDQHGFVWCTTYGGLSRFDGESFTNYHHDPADSLSLPTNLLTCIHQDASGVLWIGTVSRGVVLFDPADETFRVFRTGDPDLDEQLAQGVLAIEEDAAGRFWIGGWFGLVCWDSQRQATVPLPALAGTPRDFLLSGDREIWIGTTEGLNRFRLSDLDLQEYPLPVPDRSRAVVDCLQRADGSFWVTADRGQLWLFDPKTGQYTEAASIATDRTFRPARFAPGDGKEFWCWSPEGLLLVNDATGRSSWHRHRAEDPLSLPRSPIADVLEDASGNLFILTYDKGVAVTNVHRRHFERVAKVPAVEALVIPDDRLLIRGFDGTGTLVDTRSNRPLNTSLDLGPGTIYYPTMALQADRTLWTWDPEQIRRLDLASGISTKVPDNPRATFYLNIDRNGRLWNGLSTFDEVKGKWHFIYPELQEAFPELRGFTYAYSPIHFDRQNRLWAALHLEEGPYFLLHYDLQERTGRIYPGIQAHHFFTGREGRFYIRTEGPLLQFDPGTDSLREVDRSPALNRGILDGREDRHGNLWLATMHGLRQYQTSSGVTRTFTIEDGFPVLRQPITRRLVEDEQGWFYTDINMREMVRFHPDSLVTAGHQERARIRILDFYLGRQRQQPGRDTSFLTVGPAYSEEIGLRHDQADFGFRFAMPLFYKSAEIEYFYRLVPYQDAWISAETDNEVHFSLVPPGRYQFEVKARGENGVWSENIARVQLRIHPPWWKTWWAYIGYGLLLLGVAILVIRFEIRRRLAASELRQLKEVNDLKARLYTNITHEFRTPLTVILGMVENIQEDSSTKRLIKANSIKLLRLIDQLLDLAKLESRAMPVQWVRSNVIPYLRYLIESFASLAQERGIALKLECDRETLDMDYDEVKLQQIIYNLVSNALKFTPRGGWIRVTIEQHSTPAGQELVLTVADSGIGIQPEDQAKIFDRFFQADQSMTRPGEGTGIGLALTRELVLLLGGRISLQSEAGKGSRFTVRLPITRQARIESNPAGYRDLAQLETREGPAPEELPTGSDRPRLLLIEDNPDLVAYMRDLLHHDFDVTVAIDGQAGVDVALESIPDIIISDVMMPKMDGYTVCATLKADHRTNHIPIILLTARVEQSDRVAGLQQGADAYLTKPFDRAELFVRLRKLLELRQVLQNRYQSAATRQRTQPDRPDPQQQFLYDLRQAVVRHMADAEETLGKVQQDLALSQTQLYRKLKAVANITPTLFARQVRLEEAHELLLTTDLQVAEIAYQVGFNDPAYFSRAFSEHFGMPPSGLRAEE